MPSGWGRPAQWRQKVRQIGSEASEREDRGTEGCNKRGHQTRISEMAWHIWRCIYGRFWLGILIFGFGFGFGCFFVLSMAVHFVLALGRLLTAANVQRQPPRQARQATAARTLTVEGGQ